MEFKLEAFFFNTPIYYPIEIDDIESNDFQALFYNSNRRDIEGYNPWEKAQTTFTISEQMTSSNFHILQNGGYGTVKLKCKRYDSIFRFYIVWLNAEKVLIKLGQHPSVADFHLGEIKKYNNVLSQDKLKEITRAIGLAANGVGIGSFVYLRRVFEGLINEAMLIAIKDKKVLESDFQKARMDDKIDLLSAYLPDFLVENKGMYSILSLGVHELDEESCLAHFDTLRVGIEIILDEKLDEFRKRKKIDAAKMKLAELKGNLKK